MKSSVKTKTAEVIQHVTGPLLGELSDWPQNIQEVIHAALERLRKKTGLDYKIIGSYCDRDAEFVDETKGWYVCVRAMAHIYPEHRRLQ